ncbi:MAG TPA: alpha-1,4-glucan--maltose-1-phosphate maltosyltransferase [Bryobacteraceae bacterium]|nr:alpha-1,4-glucan--maltose-1-phosphate maltosyltransferase [Bryobacteraceae bacterium]
MTVRDVEGRRRAVIEGVEPQVDGGRYPAKRCLGDAVVVEADIFTDGHDLLAGVLLYKRADADSWMEEPMAALVNDRWRGQFVVDELGPWVFTVEAWVDAFKTWRRDMEKRIAAGQDASVDYLIGADLIDSAAGRASARDAQQLLDTAAVLRDTSRASEFQTIALDPRVTALMARYPDRSVCTRYERELRITVDPVRARFSAWYEFFPRSTSPVPGRHGTFRDAETWLPYVAQMGFDVLYLPPIHPIGLTFRKGKNNSVKAEAGDVGSPWAIGASAGGHKSIHPDLGTPEEFRSFVGKAREHGIQIALDIAFQAAPDHPYVKEHPQWFRSRPDGTIQYAENPPKKYQDIYPFDFETEDWEAMWRELTSVFLHWIEQGVEIFRVDNPHTKAFPFWEWAIAAVKRRHPQVLFLSEAFTRPKVMYRLGKLGFSQSYTYFPWRHTKQEITDYFTELTQTGVREFFRPNHWPNTPDILTEFLQTSERPGFMLRFLLASLLGANYGIYGPTFEQMVNAPLRHGSEEYLDSEKYQIHHWDLQKPDSLAEFIALVNRIRRENAALQNDHSLRFHNVSNDQLLCFSKQSPDGSNLVLVVINLDPHHTHTGFVELPAAEFGIEDTRAYQMHDLLTGARYIWHGSRNFVEVNPLSVPAQVFRVLRRMRTEQQFEYFL